MTMPPTAAPPDAPRPSAAEVRRLLDAELALPSRLGHTLLLLAALGMAGVTGALLLTEPALPPRTRAAFAVLSAIGLAWAAFAAWVLARRRVLHVTHRVVAARLAVAVTAVFTLGAWAVGASGGAASSWRAAVGTGVVMLAGAVALLVRARRRVAALSRRRRELERRLHGADGSVG